MVKNGAVPPLLMSVPNVSASEPSLVAALGESFAPAALLDIHTDADHGRSVFTLAARQGELASALLKGAAAAVQHVDLRTHGGRLVRMGGASVAGMSEREARSRAAARGRFGRNALVQGAAAELFKAWAATVRAGIAEVGGEIVLCLHDELLLHVREDTADAVVRDVVDDLASTAVRWCGPASHRARPQSRSNPRAPAPAVRPAGGARGPVLP